MTHPNAADVFQTSAQQASILHSQQLSGAVLTARLQWRLTAPLDRVRFEAALTQVCERHEILRTLYKSVSGLKLPVQEIHGQVSYRIESAVSEVQARQQAALLLEQVPVVVALLGSDQVLISLALASADEHSLKLVASELSSLYDGETLEAFEALQYADFAAWQADLDEEDIGRQGKAFWRALFADHEITHRLPFERSVDFAPQHGTCSIIAPLADELKSFALGAGLLPSEALTFFWGAFVARLSQQEKLLVAMAVDGRSTQLEQTVGHLSGRLPVAFVLQPQRSLNDNLQLFASQLGQSRSWQDCFNELDMLGQRTAEGRPLSYGCAYRVADSAAQLSWTLDAAVFEKLHLDVSECADELQLKLTFQTDMFAANMASAWLEQFVEFCKNAFADKDQVLESIGLVSPTEAGQLLAAFDRSDALTAADAPFLHQLFEKAVQRHGQRIAIHVDGLEVTYLELDRRANQLARVLRERGVGSDQIVAVYGGRSVEIIVALMGILKAGGAYLPLDPAYPTERLSFMLEDAGAKCLVALQPLHEDMVLADGMAFVSLDEQHVWQGNGAPLETHGDPADLAYVIYTSGSTGKPKGVMVSHANACSSTQARLQFYREPIQRFLMLSSFSFDSSVAGIFWTLAQGGTLYLPSESTHKDPQKIAELIAEQQISHFLALPSFYAQILEQLKAPALRCVIVAGEACPVELARRHRALLPQTVLVNEYGPSESSVWCSAFAVESEPLDERVSIGAPIPGTRLYTLEGDLAVAGAGREGELYVGGPGLARGYLNRPSLTASRFVPDPFASTPGQRLYRTGDLTSSRSEGLVEYLGRLDFQLKIRGFRIELGEIEARLGQLDNVREAAVVARDTGAGKQLVAYVVLRTAAAREAEEQRLLGHLREQLPEYMVPAFLSVLERFPLTPNGKLDRNALSALELQGSAYVEPRTALETLLVSIWQDALQLERVGIQDNFFALGGHSLLATRIRSRVQAELNIELPLRVFFEGETIELLARQVELHRDSGITGDKVDALEALFAETEAQ